jgi:hypothetical protein
MEEDFQKKVTELEQTVRDVQMKMNELQTNEVVKLTKAFTAGSGSTNGFVTININGRIYKMMTTA